MSHVPPSYTALTPYLTVSDAADAIAWYSKHFGATVTFPAFEMEDGRIGHVELEIGGARLMMASPFPEMNLPSPTELGASTAALVVYVPDADATVAGALGDGADLEREVSEQAHGARAGWIRDPFGHRWNVSTHHTNRTTEEIVNTLKGDN